MKDLGGTESAEIRARLAYGEDKLKARMLERQLIELSYMEYVGSNLFKCRRPHYMVRVYERAVEKM